MFFLKSKPKAAKRNADAMLREMVDRSQAMIAFKPDGTIINANKNFLDTLGYTLEEIQGKHHSMFVYPTFVKKEQYAQMWRDLADGEFISDQFPRLRKDGSVVWIQATYGPMFDDEGNVDHIVKIAIDITMRRGEIHDLAKALEHLRDGNLTHRCEDSDLEDIGRLTTAYNEATSTLQDAISAVNEIVIKLDKTSDEMSSSSSELSQRTENQAATLEETAAAVEELTATVRSAAQGAKEVEGAVQSARTTAKNSGDVVRDAIQAMSQIENSSNEIGKIISVIDDIAFQTNLLALNAGVEAARAGEAGRGFAVVASEVRALAQRSADAAGEIKGLISESSQHVASGVSLVGQTGTELENIISSVNSISDNVTSIARGTEEQAVTLSEINTGIGQLDQVTQHNAAMVEEATGASQTLANDAKELSRYLGKFDVGVGASIKQSSNVTPMPVREQTAPVQEQAEPEPMRAAVGASAPSAHDTPSGWEDF